MTLWEVAGIVELGSSLAENEETGQAYKNCARQIKVWAREKDNEWAISEDTGHEQVRLCAKQVREQLGVPEEDKCSGS